MLERAAPRAFARLFPLLLTDNGAEFSDCAAIERSALDPAARRCSVYYCDVRQSQQKGGCEKLCAQAHRRSYVPELAMC